LANREYQRGVKRKDLSVQRLKCVLNLVEIWEVAPKMVVIF
jgi:hypothetical protein